MPELRRISARVTVRKGTKVQWSLTNPVLLEGEMAWESDTRMLKVGDGTSAWNQLPFYESGGGGVNSTMTHDASVFPAEITTAREGLFAVKEQINKWKYCAEQDFADGLTNSVPSCPHVGYLPGTIERTEFIQSDIGREIRGLQNKSGRGLTIGGICEITGLSSTANGLTQASTSCGGGGITWIGLGIQWEFVV